MNGVKDADHPGVENDQLVQEGSPMSAAYSGKLTNEQNSIDLSWQMLLQNEFRDLRQAICSTDDDLRQLRQVLVNTVLATDFSEEKLNSFRNAQWEKAFNPEQQGDMTPEEKQNRQSTVLLVQIMQVSNVAHYGQHFHIYRKWNTRLFCEMVKAHKAGRTSEDPASIWYTRELKFFDECVLPLAHKFKECGRFGATATEYLEYALENRKEWERNGQGILEEMKVIAEAELSGGSFAT